jgi:beta-lactamase regulating signal transducer with metallopeptidase domain/HEAT repeat protein
MRLGRPAIAHALWVLVLLKLITPPVWDIALPWPRADNSPVPSATVPLNQPSHKVTPAAVQGSAAVESFPVLVDTPAPPTAAIPPAMARHAWRISPIALVICVWIGGSLACIVAMLNRVRRFHRLMRIAAAEAPRDLQLQAELLAGELSIERPPQVLLLDAGVSPMLWFAGREPKLIIPHRLLLRISLEQTRALIVHELAHLARRDHWCRVLEMIATGVCWWHPLVWAARRALREAEEQCCDAWVVSVMPRSQRAYATALVDTLDFLAGSKRSLHLPSAASGLGRLGNLQRRLTMIFAHTPPQKTLSAPARALVFALLAMLPLVPTLAQQDRTDPRPTAEPMTVQTTEAAPSTSEVVEALLEAVSVEQNENVKQQAMESIRFIGRDAAPPLVAALGDAAKSQFARMVLEILGTDAAPAVVGAVSSNDPTVRRLSLEILQAILRPWAPQLVVDTGGYGGFGAARGGRDAYGASSGFDGYGRYGGMAGAPSDEQLKPIRELQAQVAPVAVQAATDTEAQVRRAAVALLQVLPDQTKQTMPALIKALKDQDSVVRRNAASSLATLAPQHKEEAAAASAVPALAEAAKDSDVAVRGAAISALESLGPAAKPSLPALMEALKDKEPEIRAAAARAIGWINSADGQQQTQERGWRGIEPRPSAGRRPRGSNSIPVPAESTPTSHPPTAPAPTTPPPSETPR